MLFRSCSFAILMLGAALASAAPCPRIVSQSPYITRVLDWYGLSECIVGVSRYEKLDSAHDLPRTGGVKDPDADAIALLEPQLMITSDWTKPDVWRAVAPKGTEALRVGGFRGMKEVEAMLRDIGHAASVTNTDARVGRFHRDWQAAAKRVHGDGRRVLLIHACGETPYSYGRGTTIHELFAAAGYRSVADHDDLRHFEGGEGIADWIRSREPQTIVAFRNARAKSCNVNVAAAGVPLLFLDDDAFTHPGPGLLTGLEQLRAAQQGAQR